MTNSDDADRNSQNSNDHDTTDDDDARIQDTVRYLDGYHDRLAPEASGPLLESVMAARGDLTGLDSMRRGINDHDDEIPPITEDSLAVALGIVAAHDDALSGRRLHRARTTRKLDLADVARSLELLGHYIAVNELERWEQTPETLVPTESLTALARVLNVAVSAITSARRLVPTPGIAMSARFRGLLRTWADYRHISLVHAQTELLEAVTGPTLRGGSQDDATVIDAIAAFVQSQMGTEKTDI